jgi:tRNA A-37 threonylcarbamoyl transferase component Bud32
VLELKPGERLAGRYVLVERLGAGGMGEVWLATQEGSGTFRRRVVIKCVPPEKAGDDRLANMLADEARLLGLLHHPNIVSPVDYVEGDFGPLLVLEHVDGPSLRTALRLARRTRHLMPESLAAWVGAEVARALQAAHEATDEEGRPLSLIHRDVSPDNVLLSRDGRVHLADFGVARAAGNSEVTAPGTGPKGKRGYMAPEQAMGRPLGPTADIFALGRVIAEAADVNCSPALRDLLDRATAERPKERYQSAGELASALGLACPPPHDPSGALANWLHDACNDAFTPPPTSPGPGTAPAQHGPRTFHIELGPETAARVQAHPRTEPPPAELFASVAHRRRSLLRLVVGLLVLLCVGTPLLLVAEARGFHLERAPLLARLRVPQGQLVVRSRPDGAEVYVDGTLQGLTPLALPLAEGRHSLRVGSLKLERWRAVDLNVRGNTEHRVEVDLTE